MAEKLVLYYEKAKEIGGFKAQMALAMKSLIPLNKARGLPDSKENLEKMKGAYDEIEKEFI